MTPAFLPAGGDTESLAALHAICFPDPWDAVALAGLLATPGTFAFTTAHGFILARAAGVESEILTLAVHPDHRRHGEALAFVRAAADRSQSLGASAFFLEVAAGNAAAQGLYARLGFLEAGLRKAYYAKGRAIPEDALILRSNLPLSPLGKSPAAG